MYRQVTLYQGYKILPVPRSRQDCTKGWMPGKKSCSVKLCSLPESCLNMRHYFRFNGNGSGGYWRNYGIPELPECISPNQSTKGCRLGGAASLIYTGCQLSSGTDKKQGMYEIENSRWSQKLHVCIDSSYFCSCFHSLGKAICAVANCLNILILSSECCI